MTDFLRYDGRKRLRGSCYLAAGMSVLAATVLWVYPSIAETFQGDELLEAYPSELLGLFDVRTMASLEGFLAFELYTFGWTILLGLYLAYSAAGIVADDVEHGRMDSLLAMPVSRRRLLLERFAALAVPILVVNATVACVVVVGAWLVGESLPVIDVVGLHLLSIPYLFACAGIGLCCSVAFDRASVAQRVALGVTFGLFLLESLLVGTDYEAVGAVAPMRYFTPNDVLLDGTYDPVGAAALVAITAVLVASSVLLFERTDI